MNLKLLHFLSLLITASSTSVSVWTWLSGSTDIALSQLKTNSEIVNQVSFGGFSVSANLTFVDNLNRTILSAIHDLTLESHPIIGGGSITALRHQT